MYINTFNEAMRERFGRKIYRLSLDCGFTCPNRDGTAGVGGCIFCSGAGAGNFAGKGATLGEMIAEAKERVRSKAGEDCGYVAYFQSFTNTYAPAEKLRELFFAAILREDICAISVATRPDCLPPETIALLKELNRIKPVWVELGLQTSDDRTAALINRCYPTAVYDRAVGALHDNGLEIVTHIMLGLPGENRTVMLDTVRHAAGAGMDGVKLHLTHVNANTPLARMYRDGEYSPLSLDGYADILCEAIEYIPRDTIIHRFTGDGDKKELIAPAWSGDKKRVLNHLKRVFAQRDVEQGCKA